jgi:hypothetical protein
VTVRKVAALVRIKFQLSYVHFTSAPPASVHGTSATVYLYLTCICGSWALDDDVICLFGLHMLQSLVGTE